MQKARRHHTRWLRPLVSVWFQVLFHPLIQGTFHLSLTVLVHYRSLRSIQPWRMVPPYSDRISRVPPYSISFKDSFQLQDYHPLWFNFPVNSTSLNFSYRSPTTLNLPKQIKFRLLPVRSPLLTESRLISFPLGTQMFQFPRFASTPYKFRCRYL